MEDDYGLLDDSDTENKKNADGDIHMKSPKRINSMNTKVEDVSIL